MTKRSFFSILLSCLCSLLTCVLIDATPPSWYAKQSSSRSTFIGYGAGTSYEEAGLAAKLDIASQLSVSLYDETHTQRKENDLGYMTYAQRRSKSETHHHVRNTIHGLVTVKQSHVNGRYYTAVSLDKKNYLRTLTEALKQDAATMKSTLKLAKKTRSKNKLKVSLEAYQTVLEALPHFFLKQDIHNAHAKRPFTAKRIPSSQTIKNQIKTILSDVTVQVVDGDKQTGQFGRTLTTPITFEARYKKDTLAQFPIKVSYSDLTLISEGLTDTNGRFSVQVIAIPQPKKAHQLQAKLLMDKVFSNAYTYHTPPLGTARYTVTPQSIRKRIQLDVTNRDGERLLVLEDYLSEQLHQMGFDVFEPKDNADIDIVIKGQYRLIDEAKVKGALSEQRLVKVALSLQLFSKGHRIGTLVIEETALDNTRKAAIKRTYPLLNIPQQELYRLIAFDKKGVSHVSKKPI